MRGDMIQVTYCLGLADPWVSARGDVKKRSEIHLAASIALCRDLQSLRLKHLARSAKPFSRSWNDVNWSNVIRVLPDGRARRQFVPVPILVEILDLDHAIQEVVAEYGLQLAKEISGVNLLPSNRWARQS